MKATSINDLTKMKEELQTKSDRVKTQQGKESALLDRLNKEFNCKTLDEANKVKKNMIIELDKRDAELVANIEELKLNYDWDFDNV